MTARAAPEIIPCDGRFGGRLISDYCDECGHVLAAHRQDRVCSICQAVAQLHAEIPAAPPPSPADGPLPPISPPGPGGGLRR